MARHADTIITNGQLVTFDEEKASATALAIRGSEIIAVGNDRDIKNLAGPDTVIIDAQNNTVLPGFIDSHVHLFSGAVELNSLNLNGVDGTENFSKHVRDYSAQNSDLDIIFGFWADYNILDAGANITRHELDKIIADRPFAVMAPDHHTVWANTKALEAAGILNGGEVDKGCEIVMGEDGLASGELLEAGAFFPIVALTPLAGRDSLGYVTGEDPVPPATPLQRKLDKETLIAGLKHCASHGITSLHNMDGNFYQLELLSELEDEGELLCRTQVPMHLKNYHPVDKLADAAEMRTRFSGNMVWSNRVKMFMDGVVDARTAFMLKGYVDKPESTGEALFSAEHFNEACILADSMGLQISVHAIGDAAVRRTLDGYEAARKANGVRDSRHRIEHIEVLHIDDLPRFRQLDVIASMQPLHSPASGCFEAPPKNVLLHDDQRPLSFPWQTLRETGTTMIFSTDWPVVPVDVMPSIKGAVAAKDLGAPWSLQRQSLTDTLAAYTRDGAYAEFSEAQKGRLKAGMLADIVIMSHDLYAMDVEELDQARATMTICGGRTTYQA